MEKQEQDSIQAFDTLYTTNQIQILKILLPYCAPDTQKSLTVMIRFLELQYTLSFVRSHPECFRSPSRSLSLGELCEKIKGYCPAPLRSMLEQFQSMQNAMQMYEEMKQMMELFGDAAPFSQNEGGERGSSVENAGKEHEPSPSPFSTEDNSEKASSAETSFAESSFTDAFSADPMSMLMGMLSPSQKEMFRLFQSEFQNPREQETPVHSPKNPDPASDTDGRNEPPKKEI